MKQTTLSYSKICPNTQKQEPPFIKILQEPDITHYSDHDLDFYLYENILQDPSSGTRWVKYLERHLSRINPKIITGNRRLGTIFADEEGTYNVKYKDKVFERKAWCYSEIPGLLELKLDVEQLLDTTFETCLIQYYKNGKIGIPPHRDNVLKKNIMIAGLTFGQTREFVLNSFRDDREIKVNVTNGSLYVMKAPTNDRWSHSVPKDESVKPRISITFRDK
jgi:alkylated DNA repair dioxygenase AlkB